MLELAFSGYMFKKYRNKNKENLDNTNNTKPSCYKKYNYQIIIMVIEVIILIGSLVLFFQCGNLKDKFNFLEFLAALCYPMFYLIYRLFVPVNNENCKSDAQKIAEHLNLLRNNCILDTPINNNMNDTECFLAVRQ